MQVITSVEDAKFLLEMSHICVDIETQTTAPHHGWGTKFGLSACAPITWVALHAEGYPTVVFDLRQNGANDESEISRIGQFISDILSRPRITIIGHNVSFDLRSLGNQFGFRVHLDSNVWDTLTMAILLLMAEAEGEQTALISLVKRYGLLTENELEFSERMKQQRGVLDGEASDDVLKYVALDAIAAQRLYKLQKLVIDTSPNPKASPRYLRDLDTWTIVDVDKCEFNATKSWKNLPTLVEWEQRISRWSCNAAIDGVRLDIDYVHKHLEQLSTEFGDVVRNIMAKSDPTNYTGFDLHFSTLAWYRLILQKLHEYRISHNNSLYKTEIVIDDDSVEREKKSITKWYTPRIDTNKWLNYVGAQGGVHTVDIYLVDRKDKGWYNDINWKWTKYLENFPNDPPPDTDVPDLSLTKFVFEHCYKQDVYNGWMRANYKAKWLYYWYTMTKPIEASVLVNKDDFAKYYVFCLEMCKFPESSDIARLTDLVTGDTKEAVENDNSGLLNYKKLAMEADGWSLGKAALKYYFPKQNEEDHDELEHDFRIVADHSAKMTRIEEFLRHAESDGRIHSTIARKTRTGRATSTNMNLQNIDTKFFRGYLVADNDDRLLGGVDVSNAENWFAALTFADNALALACAGGDFHAANTRAYWPERTKELERKIALGDVHAKDEFKALRKLSKFITFGGAYGAGKDKIARMVGCSKEEAKQILANRDIAFPNYAEGKKTMAKRATLCYNQGIRPPFTTLWTGRRVSVPLKLKTEEDENGNKAAVLDENGNPIYEATGYKCANYLQQGGVGELIWRAVVLASEFFEREGWDVKIPLQVHDEIIFDAPLDIFFQAGQKIIQIIAEVVPESILKRTVPACRFLSDLGADNGKKWGWRYNTVYPLPEDVYVNRWGIHKLAEGEKEAPMWIGDLANGYTLESEILAANSPEREDEVQEKEPQQQRVELVSNTQWEELSRIISAFWKTVPDLWTLVEEPADLIINGEKKGTFEFPERMLIQQDMHHKGHDPNDEYWNVWGMVDSVKDASNALLEWMEKYAN